jgi:hypothetical protein
MGVLHVALGVICLVLARVVRTFVWTTGGEVFFVWKSTVIIAVFLMLPMIWLLPLRSSNFERGLVVIMLDSFYIIGGLASFVYYANNILISMG